MLEDQVAYLLQRYLGNYVRGLNKEALKISVWRGDVELSNMQLKPEALNALKLPVKVKAGFLGSVKLKVPWSRLGQDPVLVYLDRIYLLAESATHVEGCSEDAVQEAKRNRVLEMETKLLEKAQQLKTEVNKSWLGSFINTIIGNLKLSISNIHIRYEDLESNPGHPFSAGVTLEKLSAFTVDDSGKEAFVTGGALDRIKKFVELEKLAFYLDADIIPWSLDVRLERLSQCHWDQVFKSSIKDGKPFDSLGRAHAYVLQPVSGSAQYTKLRHHEIINDDQALQHANLILDDVTLSLSKHGYRDIMKLVDNFAAFNQRLKYAHYRPAASAKSDPRSWWKYAYRANSEETKKGSGKLSWEHVLKYARLRKRYISLYASLLKADMNRIVIDDNQEIAALDREIDIDLILQWRMLAHKFVEQSVETEATVKKQKQRKSWWSFGRNSQSSKHDDEPLRLDKDDWERLNNIIGYKETENNLPLIHQAKCDSIHTSLEIHMRHNASKLIGESLEVLADLSCDRLDCSIRLYSEAKVFDVKLASYQLSSPSGLIAESASSYESLVGVFSYKPLGSRLDWSMVAKASPCYITYLKEPIHQIINFFGSSTAISRTVALETVAALQMTIDDVKRTAQQQVNKALRDRSRFQLDLDIAAPKITIPSEFCPDGTHSTKLLLDLGHLVIQTQDDDISELEEDLYLNFDFVLSDVSAVLVDGDYNWTHDTQAKRAAIGNASFLPVIDKCGVIVCLQQIRIENPLYPSTRLALRLPSLCFHFSPARYHRLMHVSKIFQEDSGSSDTVNPVRPWDHADFDGVVPMLVWKGREAVWQQNYLCLTGCFLYILECPVSKSYKACISLRGKQICQVSAENVGGVEHVLAVCPLRFNGKIVEDVNSVVLRCNSDDSVCIWKNRLRAAVYRASGSAAISYLSDVWSEPESHSSSDDNSNTMESESLFVTGFLDELKMCFSCYPEPDASFPKVLLANESHLVEFRATGGQVEVSVRSNDIFIGTLLKSLEIEDLVSCTGHRPYFLARSFIHTSNNALPFNDVTVHQAHGISYSHNEGDDQFYEASENLVDDDFILHSSGSMSGEGARSSFPLDNLNSKLRNFSRIPYLLPCTHITVDDNRDVFSCYQDNFVKAQIANFDRISPLYENVDNQIVVTLSTLSFFCRRRTVLAIVGFVAAINIEDEPPKHYIEDPASDRNALVDDDIKDLDSTVQETTVKGLLGKGKSRIIFNLIFSMTRAQVVLVKDEETTLATLSQDNLRTNIKVYPSSFSITASLGNLKVSDGSLHSEHMYFWICDMRNSEGSSFVELEFNSHCADDHDFDGYDYSLFGKLSEVQIVFLNRFVQEVISYFSGLVPSTSAGVGKLYDNVTNTDKWLVSTEVDGSPALKLHLSFWKPIILMPQKTESTGFLKLDVVHITVWNSFQWIYGCKDDIGAVHLEILNVQVEDINLNIGNRNELGESIIQDVNGISITVQRTLRDLLHQLPKVEASIEMLELKAALSSKEYEIITECASCNISEAPNFISPQGNDMGRQLIESIEPLTPLSDAPEPSTHEVGSWLELKLSFVSNLIELRLHPGATRDASLATVQAIGAWLVYKSDSQGEGFLSATLKSFTVTDDREGTQEEFRLAIRKPSRIGSSFVQAMSYDNDRSDVDVLALSDPRADFMPTMLVLDARFSAQSTHVCICAQRPQLLVALDFLLAFAEFFYPTVDDMLLNDDKESSFSVTDAVILSESIYCQQSAEFSFSPEKPLVVDDERYIEFVYDGNGGTLYLLDRGGSTLISPSVEPMIYVADGKMLQFKNVVIKNGRYIDSCVLLGANSSYSASEDDHVYFESDAERPLIGTREGSNEMQQGNTASEAKSEFTLELQAIGPELTFYNTSTGVGESILLSNRLLHAEFDVFCRLVLNGDTTEMSANVLGLSAESNGLQILEPLDISTKFSNASGKKNVHIVVSETFMNFSFDILKLFLAVEEDLMKFFQTTSKKLIESCLAFDKIGTISDPSSHRAYSFWRPRAPPGFAALGDYLTPQDKPPTKGVHSVNTAYVRLKRPLSFKLIWPVSESEGEKCFVWLPVAPQGYVALGCVASLGNTPPPLSSAYCILASLVSPCALRDCITVSSKNELTSEFAFWRVDNSVGTFLPAHPVTLRPTQKTYELRNIFFNSPVYFSKQFENGNHSVSSDQVTTSRSEQYLGAGCERNFEHVANFKLIWWNQGSSCRKKISIWRPVVPEGVVFFGDVAIEGYGPPNSCVVLRDSGEGLFGVPSDFQIVAQIKKQRDVGGISLWLPRTVPGFVSLGCIACKDVPSTSDISSLRCMRTDMVCGSEFLKESLWDTSCMNITTKPFSIWGVDNMMGTFFVRNGFKVPPRRFAFKPQSLNVPTGSDDIVIDGEVKTLSATLFDVNGGLMVPLLNLSMNGIQFNLHGRSHCFHSAVSFSLMGRGYNDKYDAWEPLLETVDGIFRYQYNVRSPAAVSQLRFTFSRDLNFNISVSNANMIFQAYASWSNLSNIHDSCRIHGSTTARSDSSLNIDIHQRKSYYIVLRNNIGMDIFLRITKPEGTQQVTRMPSGDLKYVKAPVLKTMSGSHVGGRSCKMLRKLITVIIADAEVPNFDGLSSHLYAVAVRILSDRGSCSLPNQQSVRTCGKGADYLTQSGSDKVNWNEMFFFKVDMLDHYIMELVITDFGKGHPIGFISASLEQMARTTDNPSDYFDFINDLVPIDFSMASPTLNDVTNSHAKKACGRIRCSVLSSTSSEAKIHEKLSADSSNSACFEISPSRNGPWTTMRLNYAARFACLRFGEHVVSSEISSRDNNKYISFRSLVTVRNDTEIVLELRLELNVSGKKEAVRKDDDGWKDAETATNTLAVDELFETERYDSPGGWISCAVQSDEYASRDGILSHEISAIQLPSGWEWVDDWNVDVGSVNSADGWVYAPDVESLKWPDSYNPLKFVNYARQRRWIWTRQKVAAAEDRYIPVGLLNPRTAISLPLAVLSQSEPYTLQVRPFNLSRIGDYSWSSVVDSRSSDTSGENNYNSKICVSALNESEKLLYCDPTPDASSDITYGIWFCLSVKASVIAKDIQCNPIEDWCLIVKCPISLTNFLPMATEFSVLEMQAGGNFVSCSRGILFPGTPVNIHTGDTRNPLYLSLLPQAGWLPVHDAVLISHPKEPPSKGLNLRSSISGRMVQIILDQNQGLELPALAKAIRIYAPYWFSISRCPPLTCKLLDLSLTKKSQKMPLPFRLNKKDESVLAEIAHEEIYNDSTIASALNFKYLGASLSVDQFGPGEFGPVEHLSSLGNMDEQVEVRAYDAEGRCMRLCFSSKPCPFQSVPTKVVSIRPFITFTNRLGERLYIKFSSEDERKVLNAFDARVAYVHCDEEGPIKIQVQLEDTEWSLPVHIVKEDTLQLVLRKCDGNRNFLRTEIRGYEEGSRFVVVFRVGSTRGPMRIENRIAAFKQIRVCQSDIGNSRWTVVSPLSTINFSWEDPYGPKLVDIEINGSVSMQKFDLEKSGTYSVRKGTMEVQLHVVEIGDLRVACFTENGMLGPISASGIRFLRLPVNWETSSMMQKDDPSPVEVLIDLGVLGISFIDHKPSELCYVYLERVSVLYSTGYGRGSTSRFKLLMGYMQLDNQLTLTTMPVLLAPEQCADLRRPVFKMSVTIGTNNSDGIMVLPHIGVRVTEKLWRLNIHEPIIWAFVDFYKNLQLDTLPKSSNVSQIDPEIRIDLVDISEIRLKIALETAPAQRPHGVLGVWSPILSAVGNAFKIQVHIRKAMHKNRFMRRSTIAHSIVTRIWRDLIHNPLHLIFSLDVLGIASSTLSSLSRRFAELSTDGQFLQLRTQQVRSRRITGVGDGFIQGTEAFAQGVAFGVSGVVTKPMESARQNGLLGLAHGLGKAFLGFVVQPVSGALDLVSLTVYGIGASCTKCLEVFLNKSKLNRIRNPRAIRADSILRDYSEEEAVGQMILHLAEAGRILGCSDIFKEPSKFAWSDYYENHFIVPGQRIVLITSKRVMLLQCPNMNKIDKTPSKILWDVPWGELMALELAKAGFENPSHLILHLRYFRKSESFVRIIKCRTVEASEEIMPQAIRICGVIRKMWKAYESGMKCIVLKVPSNMKYVFLTGNGSNESDRAHKKIVLKSRQLFVGTSSATRNDNIVKHCINFVKVWSSEGESKGKCALCQKQKASKDGGTCSIWRAVCNEGYVIVGDIARVGCHPPNVAVVYRKVDNLFSPPVGYDLIWRNCAEDYGCAVSIWLPRPPEGFVSLGCVAVAGFFEPEEDFVYCVAETLAEEAEFEEQKIWSAPHSYPWACHIYQVKSDALHFVALRQLKEDLEWKVLRIKDDNTGQAEAESSD